MVASTYLIPLQGGMEVCLSIRSLIILMEVQRCGVHECIFLCTD
jgi:hypothetical protein